MAIPQWQQVRPDFGGSNRAMSAAQQGFDTLGRSASNINENILAKTKLDEARKQQEIANARQAALDVQNKQLFDLKMGEADRIAKEREANIEFGSKLPEMMDQRTWAPVGDLLNQSDRAKLITDRLGYAETDTPEVRAAKEAAQLELSKSYDEAGQKQYLSESIGQEISARRAAGLPVTQDMLNQYTSAKKEELTSAQKAAEAASKLASEKGTAADKTLLELEKLREKYASNKTGSSTGSKSSGRKGPIDTKEAETIKSYISQQISPFGISLGEGDLDKLIAAGVREGYSAQDILKAGQAGVEEGWLDTTFDYKKAIKALPDEPGTAGFGGGGSSYGQIMDSNALNLLEARQRAEAAQARQRAADALLSPEEKRAAKAKESLAGIMAKIEGFNVPGQIVPKAEVDTSPQNESKKEEIKKVVEKIDGGLNKDGTLNADAIKAINDSLENQGIKEKIQKGTTAEKANEIVERLTQKADGFMTPTARSERAQSLVNTLQVNPFENATSPFTTISDAYNARWNRPTQNSLAQQVEIGLNNAATALARQRGIPYEKALEELKQLQMRTIPTNNRNEVLRMPR